MKIYEIENTGKFGKPIRVAATSELGAIKTVVVRRYCRLSEITKVTALPSRKREQSLKSYFDELGDWIPCKKEHA